MMENKEKNLQTVQLIWLIVEVFCIIRSAIASYNVTINLANGDVLFAVFTVGVIELSLFAMLIMASKEAVAPIAAIILIAFSAVLQYAELVLMTSQIDEQTKSILRYAVSFAPTALLLIALVKRMTENEIDNLFGRIGDMLSGLSSVVFGAPKETRAVNYSVPLARKPRGRKPSAAKQEEQNQTENPT